MTKVFISYSHKQGEWVWDRLVPCLKAGSAKVLIDRERFEAGKAVVGQMDGVQDQADRHVLLFSPDYLNSEYCKHEMNRALKRDPKFQHDIVVPLMRIACSLPSKISRWNPPLYVDLQDDNRADPWSLLLQQCGADLGTTAPDWLSARDDIVQLMRRRQSVNLVVHGEPRWRELLEHITEKYLPGLALVNLEHPATTSRYGLLSAISQALGERVSLPGEPQDLAGFDRIITARSGTLVGLTHFDLVSCRDYYDIDLFAALRLEFRTPFGALLSRLHPLSTIDIKTVELGRTI